ncbi:MAG: glycoside hydrolase family 3 protein [Ignavibacteria bacterium]|nr:glycoside hydrolase family 3 protein [Ignavibacteria bacterium]
MAETSKRILQKFVFIAFIFSFLLINCGKKEDTQTEENKTSGNETFNKDTMTSEKDSLISDRKFMLNDFYTNNPLLDNKVNKIFNSLSDDERISQMIMTSAGTNGLPEEKVNSLIRKKQIGGIIILGGIINTQIELRKKFAETSEKSGGLPLIFASDAEISLINRKIPGLKTTFPKANEIKDEKKCVEYAKIISDILRQTGIQINFAPVVDAGFNKEIIGDRSFGTDSEKIIKLSNAFIKETQKNNIAACVKHFPGHGNVTGDSHKGLPVIKGEMKELQTFEKVIKESGVLLVMVGHIAVNGKEYNTEGMPASLSGKIITDLLKQKMNFNGLVITDAMNMGALNNFSKPSLSAVKAGCDIILMPTGEETLLNSIKEQINKDENLKQQVYNSVKKIIRLKICSEVIN